MNVELIVKGSIIMKKKRFLSLFAAFAVALCCLIVPGNSRIGLNTVAEASDTSGLSIEALGSADIEALMPGDEVKVTLTVPNVTKKADSILFNIKFNSETFSVVQWYAEEPDALIGATTQSAGVSKVVGEDGYSFLSYGASGVGPDGSGTIDLTAGAQLVATLMVRKDVKVTGGSYDIVLDRTADLFQCGYYVSAQSYVECWKPTEEESVVVAKVANSITGMITGVDISDINISSGGTLHVLMYNGTELIAWAKVDELSGEFTIKSCPEDASKTYDLKLGKMDEVTKTVKSLLWGVFTDRSLYPEDDKSVILTPPKFTNNKLTDKTGTVQIKGSKDMRPIGSLKFRLFGDVDGKGSIGANDATQILRHIVGNTSSIDAATVELLELNKGISNVVNSDSVLNAKDATQILRKVVGVSSVFDMQ